jgi:hypothetical protein
VGLIGGWWGGLGLGGEAAGLGGLEVSDSEAGVVECVVDAVVVLRVGIEEAVDGGVVVTVGEVTQVAERLDGLGDLSVGEREAWEGAVAFAGRWCCRCVWCVVEEDVALGVEGTDDIDVGVGDFDIELLRAALGLHHGEVAIDEVFEVRLLCCGEVTESCEGLRTVDEFREDIDFAVRDCEVDGEGCCEDVTVLGSVVHKTCEGGSIVLGVNSGDGSMTLGYEVGVCVVRVDIRADTLGGRGEPPEGSGVEV